MTAKRALLRAAVGGLACTAAALWPGPTRAAPPAGPVEAAERAYKDVEFGTQLAEATRALEEGHHDPATLANIYRLLGIAHAALSSPDAAKKAFMMLLAIDRDVALEHVLSPRLRSPYMEARGFWDVSRTRLELELAIDTASGALDISLSDPLQMGTRVRVIAIADEPVAIADRAAAPVVEIAPDVLAPHAGKPLQVELLDAYQNVILTRVLTPRPPAAATPAPRPSAPTSPAPRANSSGPPTLALVLGSGALLALGGGVTAHVVRENKASEWNGTACEQLGRGSRADQCSSVDDQRRSAQAISFVGYAAGGALLAASVVSYLLTTDVAHEPEPGGSKIACGASAHGLGLSCNTVW